MACATTVRKTIPRPVDRTHMYLRCELEVVAMGHISGIVLKSPVGVFQQAAPYVWFRASNTENCPLWVVSLAVGLHMAIRACFFLSKPTSPYSYEIAAKAP